MTPIQELKKTTLPVKLRELPTPAEVAVEVDRYCKKLGLTRKRYRQGVEDDLKLQYYFGGQYVGFLRTDEGPVVVASGQLESEEFDRQLDALPPEKRRCIILEPAFRWKDYTSLILTPFSACGDVA